jgi:hypothetical protein
MVGEKGNVSQPRDPESMFFKIEGGMQLDKLKT